MALPHEVEARTFYQAAIQRFEDAQFLLEAERTMQLLQKLLAAGEVNVAIERHMPDKPRRALRGGARRRGARLCTRRRP